jgi:hypothetical protein
MPLPDILYIQIIPSEIFAYQNVALLAAKEKYTGHHFFDIDNHSDSVTLHYALTFIEKSEKLLVIIDAHNEDETIKTLYSIFDKLIKYKHKVEIIQQNKHTLSSKLLSPLLAKKE